MNSALATFSPARVLVLHFGPLAEVTLSLPALKALRGRFPRSHITVAAQPDGCQVVELASCADRLWPVRGLDFKEAVKPWVMVRWARFLGEVRQGGYDLTINLQSRGGANLLAWLSQARVKLGARRAGALDFLFNPWLIKENPRKHLVDRYFDILRALGIEPADRVPRLRSLPDVHQRMEKRLTSKGFKAGQLLVGLFIGGGDAGRWDPIHFVDLGNRLVHALDVRLFVAGPADAARLRKELKEQFPAQAILLGGLSVAELVSAFSHCTVVVSDDAGAANVAAAAGAPVLGLGLPWSIAPPGPEHILIQTESVDDVFQAAGQIIQRSRTTALFRE